MPNDVIPAPSVRAGRRGLLAVAPAIDVAAPAGNGDPSSPGGETPRMPRWVGGFTWEPGALCREALGPVAIRCIGTVDKELDRTPLGDAPIVKPIALLGSDWCETTFDRDRPRRANAEANLLATRSHQLEAELWSGAIATAEGDPTPFLANNPTIVVAPGLVTGLAALEQSIAECTRGARSMILASPRIVATWYALNALTFAGDVLVTALENIVVAGSGFDTSTILDENGDPDEAASGSEWVIAAPMVHQLLGPVVEFGSSDASRIDRSVNSEIHLVEQPAAAVYEPCCVFAAEVSQTSDGLT